MKDLKISNTSSCTMRLLYHVTIMKVFFLIKETKKNVINLNMFLIINKNKFNLNFYSKILAFDRVILLLFFFWLHNIFFFFGGKNLNYVH